MRAVEDIVPRKREKAENGDHTLIAGLERLRIGKHSNFVNIDERCNGVTLEPYNESNGWLKFSLRYSPGKTGGGSNTSEIRDVLKRINHCIKPSKS